MEESPFLPPLPPPPAIGINLLFRLFLREIRIAQTRAAAPQTKATTAMTMTAIAHPGNADDELLLLLPPPLFLSLLLLLLLFVFVEFVVLVMFVVLLLPGGAISIFVLETVRLKSIYIQD